MCLLQIMMTTKKDRKCTSNKPKKVNDAFNEHAHFVCIDNALCIKLSGMVHLLDQSRESCHQWDNLLVANCDENKENAEKAQLTKLKK